jgi:hypothetical protein
MVEIGGFRRPEYSNTFPKGTLYDTFDSGVESVCIFVTDDAAAIAILDAATDVAKFPNNIDAQVGANLATVQAKLESFNLPGDAVTAGSIYRTIIKGIVAIYDVMQRYTAITQNQLLFGATTNLDRTLGSIPANIRNALQQACDERGYDTSGLTGASTIRDLLKKLATQPPRVGGSWGAL